MNLNNISREINTMLKLSPKTGFIQNLEINNTSIHLNNLMKVIPWQTTHASQRKVCNIGCDYTYSGRTVKGQPFSVYKPLQGLLDKVNKELNTNFNSILLNWYPKGSNVGLGFHKDLEKELVSNPEVLSISLGCTSKFTIKNMKESITVNLKDGDVFYMDEACQQNYYHGIPKQVMPADRISLTFREFKVTLNPSNFNNFSGGAYGTDTFSEIIGREFGFISHTHFRPYDNIKMSATLARTVAQPTILSEEETEYGRDQVNHLLDKNFKDNIAGNLQGRNYYQVSNSDSVFCFSKRITRSSISGGTNTAFQLAIKLNKPVYLFDVLELKWFMYNTTTESLEECPTPTLTQNYSIVGTRDVENYSIMDRQTKQWIPRKEYLGIDTENAVKNALRDLYRKTLATLQS